MNLDTKSLKIGDVLKSISSYSEIDDELIHTKNRNGSVRILCKYTRGSNTSIDCPTKMLDKEYVYVGVGKRNMFVDALSMSMLGAEGSWTVPLPMLKRTSNRIIDIRDIPKGYGASWSNIIQNSIPKYERSAILKRIENPKFPEAIKDLQKNRLRWFIEDSKRPFKRLLAEIIRTYNDTKAVECPECGRFISTKQIVSDGYTRAGKVFIVCPDCAGRFTIVVKDPDILNYTSNPFCLRHA